LVVTGNFAPAGNWSIVGNCLQDKTAKSLSGIEGEITEEDSCTGTLLSVWSGTAVEDLKGSATTCDFKEFISSMKDGDSDYYDDIYNKSVKNLALCTTDRAISPLGASPACECATGWSGKNSGGHIYVERTGTTSLSPFTEVTITKDDRLSTDIVAPPVVDYPVTNFPSDLFAYVFRGIPKTQSSIIKNAAQAKSHVLPDCSSLDASSSGLYWIEGDCNLGDDVGRPLQPVLIIVEDGQIDMATQTEGYGLIFGLHLASGADPHPSLQGNNGYWYGGIIVDYADIMTNGNGKIIYRKGIFDALAQMTNSNFAIVPGTWKDF